jgi:hypothetical protein
MPFERYVDYWGSFDADASAGTFTIAVDGGNVIPEDVDPTGTYAIVDGRLELRDIYLGTYRDPTPRACVHVFER